VVLGQKFLDMFKKIVIAIHPEYNTIFFTVTYHKKLMSYEMDHRKTRIRDLLNSLTDVWNLNPYVPFVSSWRSIPWIRSTSSYAE
jgi:hypothetical protein